MKSGAIGPRFKVRLSCIQITQPFVQNTRENTIANHERLIPGTSGTLGTLGTHVNPRFISKERQTHATRANRAPFDWPNRTEHGANRCEPLRRRIARFYAYPLSVIRIRVTSTVKALNYCTHFNKRSPDTLVDIADTLLITRTMRSQTI